MDLFSSADVSGIDPEVMRLCQNYGRPINHSGHHPLTAPPPQSYYTIPVLIPHWTIQSAPRSPSSPAVSRAVSVRESPCFWRSMAELALWTLQPPTDNSPWLSLVFYPRTLRLWWVLQGRGRASTEITLTKCRSVHYIWTWYMCTHYYWIIVLLLVLPTTASSIMVPYVPCTAKLLYPLETV